MAIYYDEDIEEIMEYAINTQELYKAIGKKRDVGISYLTVYREFAYRGVDTEVLALMADIELEEY